MTDTTGASSHSRWKRLPTDCSVGTKIMLTVRAEEMGISMRGTAIHLAGTGADLQSTVAAYRI